MKCRRHYSKCLVIYKGKGERIVRERERVNGWKGCKKDKVKREREKYAIKKTKRRRKRGMQKRDDGEMRERGRKGRWKEGYERKYNSRIK